MSLVENDRVVLWQHAFTPSPLTRANGQIGEKEVMVDDHQVCLFRPATASSHKAGLVLWADRSHAGDLPGNGLPTVRALLRVTKQGSYCGQTVPRQVSGVVDSSRHAEKLSGRSSSARSPTSVRAAHC